MAKAKAGNVYVNRNIIGAVVGVQPFGGSGLSGTGPKAGGPLYLRRLLEDAPRGSLGGGPPEAFAILLRWLGAGGADFVAVDARTSLGAEIALPGSVGETNVYSLHAKGRVLALAQSEAGLMQQFAAIVATGNTMVVEAAAHKTLATLPPELARLVDVTKDWRAEPALDAILFEGPAEELGKVLRAAAMREGPIVPVITPGSDGGYDLNRLLEEKVVSVNTAAAGGNASLMTIG